MEGGIFSDGREIPQGERFSSMRKVSKWTFYTRGRAVSHSIYSLFTYSFVIGKYTEIFIELSLKKRNKNHTIRFSISENASKEVSISYLQKQ